MGLALALSVCAFAVSVGLACWYHPGRFQPNVGMSIPEWQEAHRWSRLYACFAFLSLAAAVLFLMSMLAYRQAVEQVFSF